jgi:hypothetical protein
LLIRQRMELNGALSNPFVTDKSLLISLSELQTRLLIQASVEPRQPRDPPIRRPPVLELVTRVLNAADRPMRACEVHAAASELYGCPLLWHSVKEALSAYTIGGDRRFQRVGHGTYELARRSQPQIRPGRGRSNGSHHQRQ